MKWSCDGCFYFKNNICYNSNIKCVLKKEIIFCIFFENKQKKIQKIIQDILKEKGNIYEKR